ncbi:MAG: hypothetical protein WA210_15350 [Burkholderiaceae bacterium]
MITMHRPLFAALLAIPLFALFTPSPAQVQRQFPQTALRGQILFGQPPLIALNGEPNRLAPGARIRGTNNTIVLSGSLVGSRLSAHYTIDAHGLLKDVWILQDDELANIPWPSNAQEAAAWAFDPAAQRWTRP